MRQLSPLALLLVVVVAIAGYAVGQRAPARDRDREHALPASAAAWEGVADEAERSGHLDDALVALHAATAFDEGGERYLRLGFFLYEHGDWERSERALVAARERGQDSSLIEFTLRAMKRTVDFSGLFPRFHDEGTDAGPAPGQLPPAPSPALAEPPPPPEVAEPEVREPEVREPEVREPEVTEPEVTEPEVQVPAEEPLEREPEPETLPPEHHERLAGGAAAAGCEVPVARRHASGAFVVDVVVQGAAARLIVDTGASLTVLSRSFVDDNRLRLDEDGVIAARTAAGMQSFPTATVLSVAVGEAWAEDVRVAICEGCGGPDVDGLLGLDVMAPLGLSLDPGASVLRCSR